MNFERTPSFKPALRRDDSTLYLSAQSYAKQSRRHGLARLTLAYALLYLASHYRYLEL